MPQPGFASATSTTMPAPGSSAIPRPLTPVSAAQELEYLNDLIPAAAYHQIDRQIEEFGTAVNAREGLGENLKNALHHITQKLAGRAPQRILSSN